MGGSRRVVSSAGYYCRNDRDRQIVGQHGCAEPECGPFDQDAIVRVVASKAHWPHLKAIGSEDCRFVTNGCKAVQAFLDFSTSEHVVVALCGGLRVRLWEH